MPYALEPFASTTYIVAVRRRLAAYKPQCVAVFTHSIQ